jgi:hypothetical protein
MSKDTFYFSHDYNVRNDIKIKKLINKHGFLGYGLFWAIIEDLYNNTNVLPMDYECIAFDLRTEPDVIKSIINDFDLFVIEDDTFGSLSVERRLTERNEKSVKARESVLKRWNKTKKDTNVLQTNYDSNTIKESKVKESKIYVSEKSTQTDYDKFLQWFNTTRTKYLEIPSHINRLTQIDKSNLEILKKSYSNDEFNIALLNICNDKWANESNLILPNHFLKEENFVKYLNMPQRKLLTKREKQIAGWGV